MAWYDYILPVAGGVVGGLVGGPGGAVAGYGAGTIADQGLESLAGDGSGGPAPPTPSTAPTLDPNAGIGQGYGGLTPQEKAAQDAGDRKIREAYDQLRHQYEQVSRANQPKIDALQKQIDQLGTDPSTVAQRTLLYQQIAPLQKQIDDIDAQRHKAADAVNVPTADMSDPGRFAAQAGNSYSRQAPLAQLVAPNMSAYDSDRAGFKDANAQLGEQAHQLDILDTGAGQQNLVNRLNGDLSGGAPSLAKAQLDQATQANIAQQQSMAASAGPMDYGSARRAAIMAGANTQQGAIGQAAMLRAQEYQATEGLLGNTLTSQRAQTLQQKQDVLQAQIAADAQKLQAQGMDKDAAIQTASTMAQQNQFNAGQVSSNNALNQGRELAYLQAYEGARGMQQQNAIANLNAATATNTSNNAAGAQIYNTLTNADLQQQQMDEQKRKDAMNMLSTGISTYNTMNKPSPTPSNGANTGNTQPDPNGIYNPWPKS